ncbi:glycosyltransferase family 9 protein [Sutterella sp.]|uniref:glycosyltransferase family 9 protein n=1 Tax=Sutterella sp. TaxID=1981025 RepID=UPI0026DEA5B5|nr:glycosyltransferase family 9 protein [Sutterella sp.]MDO5531917.1 glycosyltransferase family 9 protein [Sutterella sp.]
MKVLIVSLRYLGDCLLAAALAPAVKAKFPDAQVDLLSFRDNLSILEGVPCIDNRIGVEHHPKKWIQAQDHIRSWNTYDWALSTMNSTRATLYSWASARNQTMPAVPDDLEHKWIRTLVKHQIPWSSGHLLDTFTDVAKPLLGDIEPLKPVAPDAELSPELEADFSALGPCVVCHPCSRYQDKNWSQIGWRDLFRRIIDSGRGVCLTGGRSEFETDYIRAITEGLPADRVLSVAGRASFGQTGRIIRRADAFVGVDTATAHVAAATGTPSVFLFGPTNVREWGPSPKDGRPALYDSSLSVQTVLNVTIVRQDNPEPCCGCTRHRCAHFNPPELGRCMQVISPDKVWAALCQSVAIS